MKIINPYQGIEFASAKRVKSITHEHIVRGEGSASVQNAYNRGIRHFAALHYGPAVPRYPMSNFYYRSEGVPYAYKDYNDVPNGDWSIVGKYLIGMGYSSFVDADGRTILTDDLPQIPNNEHALWSLNKSASPVQYYNHYNMLGNLWAEAAMGDNNGSAAQRGDGIHSLWDSKDFSKYREADNQVFLDKTFGTINHPSSVQAAMDLLNVDEALFNAIEIYNNDYSEGWNKQFGEVYNAILARGFRKWCVAVVDWQGYVQLDLTAREKEYWQSRYDAEADKSLYPTMMDYYKEFGRKVSYDRGCNVLYVPSNYDDLPANDFVVGTDGKMYSNPHSKVYTQAEAGMDAYIQGAFYASGFGNHAITNLSVDGNKVTFSVDGNATEIAAYTNKGKMVGEGNSMQVTIPKGVNFIRFEALYDEDEKKDFICTQPLFIEDNQDNDSAKRMLIL
jgi:hypothetical protein